PKGKSGNIPSRRAGARAALIASARLAPERGSRKDGSTLPARRAAASNAGWKLASAIASMATITSRSDFPRRSAIPYSVTTMSRSWRGTVALAYRQAILETVRRVGWGGGGAAAEGGGGPPPRGEGGGGGWAG